MFTLLIGGARSGKSALAVEWGQRFVERGGDVAFIATTAEPQPGHDDELAARIERHRAERPPWPTVEEPEDLGGAIGGVDGGALVVVDCLTLWVSNLMARGEHDDAVVATAVEAATTIAGRRAPSIVVTNEVGLGVHPVTELGRAYRELLGRVNRAFAGAADRTLFLAAGRVVELQRPDRFAP